MNGDEVVFDISYAAPEMGGVICVFVLTVPMWCFSFLMWLRLRRHPSYRLIGNTYLALMSLAVVVTCLTSVVSYRGEMADWRDLTQVVNQEQWAQTRGTARVTSDPELDRPGIPAGSIQVLTVEDHRFEVGLYSKNSRVRDELIREVDGEPVILYFHEHLILRIERDTGEADHE